jgi:hypothetical protein
MEPWLADLHQSEDRLRAVFESSPLAISLAWRGGLGRSGVRVG